MRGMVVGALVGTFAAVGAVEACGGSTAAVGSGNDASVDGAGDSASGDVAVGDAGAPDTAPGDAGPSCAPPSDPSKSALCIAVAPEAITFLSNDPNFDGKGFLDLDVHDTPDPDAPDGGQLPALAAASLPGADAGADAGELDLSEPIPVVRFDGLPATTVYPRAIFVDVRNPDNVGAGWWLGGYDLSNGLVDPALLSPVTLTAGVGTGVTLDLTALRALHVTLTRTATPVGNAQGPAEVVIVADQAPTTTTKLFGEAKSACANVSGTSTATADGFLFGAGPYYAFAQLDDFGAGTTVLSPGDLTSLAYMDGGFENPASTALTYAAGAYAVTQTVDLDLTIPDPDAGVDTTSCP